MNVLDLFSGIGGFSLGLEAVGMRTIGFCEIEPFPRAVLAHHWPGVPIHDDVRTLSAESVPWLRAEAARGVDLICGGFPCQDISVAGKGAGLSGARSGLWSEYARLVGELRPRWVLAENVGALKTRGVDRVCSDLEGEGYAVWPLLVGAWAVGAPHKRERVWIVAHSQRGREGLHARALGYSGVRQGWRGDQSPAQFGDGSASELSNSDAGRRGRALDQVQAGWDESERADAAHRDSRGRESHGRGSVLDGEWEASGDDADGRGERPVGSPTGPGLEGQRADTGEAQESESRNTGEQDRADRRGWGETGRRRGQDDCAGARRDFGATVAESGPLADSEGERRAQQGHGRDAGSWPRCDGTRWPARPGEPQHEWEEPRLAQHRQHESDGRSPRIRPRSGSAEEADAPRCPELSLGGAVDGLPLRLARRANREALKALGNSVVPQVVAVIGRAILESEAVTL